MAGTKNRLSSLDLVPDEAQDDIVWAVGELNQRKRTQQDILFELNDRLGTKGVDPISSSAFNRKAVKLRAWQIKMDESRYIFAGMADQFTPEKVDASNIVLGECLKMMILELSQGERSPKETMELSRAFHDMIKGQALSAARRTKLETEFKAKAEATIDKVAKAKGLSADVAENFKRDLFGVRDAPGK